MIAIAALIGINLGARFSVIVLLPASVVVIIVAGSFTDAMTTLAALIALQLGYLAGSAGRQIAPAWPEPVR